MSGGKSILSRNHCQSTSKSLRLSSFETISRFISQVFIAIPTFKILSVCDYLLIGIYYRNYADSF